MSVLKYISALLLAFLAVSFPGCEAPPLVSVEKARQAVEKAAREKAVRYAEREYREAEDLLQQGRMEVARQKGRFALLRDYAVADSLLRLAHDKGVEAANAARDRIALEKSEAETDKQQLRQDLATWREAASGALYSARVKRYIMSAEFSLAAGERLIGVEEYKEASDSFEKGKSSLVTLGKIVAEYANDANKQLATWRKWVNDTLVESRTKKTTAIIVDKSRHRLYLIKAGNLIHSYKCDLGYNSAHQKFFAGDGATPEGKYRIARTRQNGSKFYKALLLDFPNQNDQKRFRENKAKGIISRHARIGANIEIHGDGGKSKDWTDGCVALTNDGMDHLMRYVTVGTPVTIVRKSDTWP
jgi:L,D-peptidoglycan transpeptidase YkuD (ErfK/YbiS/YcfS/YnhG family)